MTDKLRARPFGSGSRPSDQAPTGLVAPRFDPSRMTPPNIWGGRGFEVCDAIGEDGEVEMGAVPRWHVSVEGVGSWPVAYFYTEADARFWADTVNAAIAMETQRAETENTVSAAKP